MAGVLVVIGGLPGVGKTTVARAVAAALPAAHLRIDAFEVALVRQRLVVDQDHVGGHGYGIALAAADTCLRAGTDVVVDAVFGVAATRGPFRDLAARYGTPAHWLRLTCSDATEHRRRVEERAADLPGHVVPSWVQVQTREFDHWQEPHTVLDTATGDPVAAALGVVRG